MNVKNVNNLCNRNNCSNFARYGMWCLVIKALKKFKNKI